MVDARDGMMAVIGRIIGTMFPWLWQAGGLLSRTASFLAKVLNTYIWYLGWVAGFPEEDPTLITTLFKHVRMMRMRTMIFLL